MDSPDHSFDLELKNMFQYQQNKNQRQNPSFSKHLKHKSNLDLHHNTHLQGSSIYQAHQASSKLIVPPPQVEGLRLRNSHLEGNRQGSKQTITSNFSSKSRLSRKNTVKHSQFTELNNQTSTFLGLTYEGASKNNSPQKPSKQNMIVVDLKNKSLSQIPANFQLSQTNQRNTVELNLENNQISSISKGETYLPQNLRSLKLSNNKLSYLGNVRELAPTLKILDLSHNRLFSIEGLKHCKKLKKLNLSFNYLVDQEANHLLQLQSLRKLNLQHNQFGKSSVVSSLISFLTNLKQINVSQNQLTETFCLNQKNHKLRELNLAENRLQYLIFDHEVTNLKVLNVSRNELIRINGLPNCGNQLEDLDLSFNYLTFISGDLDSENTFTGLKKLKILNLSSNKISLVQDEKYLIFQSLKELHLRGNRLVSYYFINSFVTSSLQVLDLGENKLIKIENIAQHLQCLEVLKLDFNQIQNPKDLNKYVNLKQLKLENNPIKKEMTASHLKQLSKLEDLSIGANLEERQLIINELPNLQTIDGVNVTIRDKQKASELKIVQNDMKSLPVIPMTDSFTIIQHNDDTQDESKESLIKKVFLEDSQDQQDIFNDVIKIGHINPIDQYQDPSTNAHSNIGAINRQSSNGQYGQSYINDSDSEYPYHSLPLQRNQAEKRWSAGDQLQMQQKLPVTIDQYQISGNYRSGLQKFQIYHSQSPSLGTPSSGNDQVQAANNHEQTNSSEGSYESSHILNLQKVQSTDYKTIEPILIKSNNQQPYFLVNSITPAMSKLNIQTISTDKYQTINSINQQNFDTFDQEKQTQQANFSTEPNFIQLQRNFLGSNNPNIQSQMLFNTEQRLLSEEISQSKINSKRLSICPSQINLIKGQKLTHFEPQQIQTGQQTIQSQSEQTVTSSTSEIICGDNKKSIKEIIQMRQDQLVANEREKEEAISELYVIENVINFKQIQQQLEKIADEYLSDIKMGNDEIREEIFQTHSTNILTLFKGALDQLENNISLNLQKKTDYLHGTLNQFKQNEPQNLFNNISEIKNSSSILKGSEIFASELEDLKPEFCSLLQLISIQLQLSQPSITQHAQEYLCKLLKELCLSIGFEVKSFQLGKYLFQNQDHVEKIEALVVSDPTVLINQSELALCLIKEFLSSCDMHDIRMKIRQKIFKLNQNLDSHVRSSSNHFTNSQKEKQLSQIKKQDLQYPKIKEYVPSNSKQFRPYEEKTPNSKGFPEKYSPMVHLSRQNKSRMKSQDQFYNINESEDCRAKRKECLSNEVQNRRYTCDYNDEKLSPQFMTYVTNVSQNFPSSHQMEKLQRQIKMQYESSNQKVISKENKENNRVEERFAQFDKKLAKITESLVTYSMYPLQPITQEQAMRTFVDEISLEKGNYEFKLLKQFLSYQGAKLTKVIKGYNYHYLNDFKQRRGSQHLMFFSSDSKDMGESIRKMKIRSKFGIITQKSLQLQRIIFLKESTDMKTGQKRKKHIKRVVLCLASINEISKRNESLNQLCQAPHQIASLKNDGFDTLYFPQDDSYLLMNDSRCVPIYLIDYYFKE